RPPLGPTQPRRRNHLPLHAALRVATSRRSQRPVRGVACMSTPNQQGIVYIVDDDEAVRDSLRWLLEANGYRVRAYQSAESFLDEYDPMQVGVLIADVRMPGMSGLELQEQLIARKSPMPIVFITGHGDVPMAVSTMKKGAVDF